MAEFWCSMGQNGMKYESQTLKICLIKIFQNFANRWHVLITKNSIDDLYACCEFPQLLLISKQCVPLPNAMSPH